MRKLGNTGFLTEIISFLTFIVALIVLLSMFLRFFSYQ